MAGKPVSSEGLSDNLAGMTKSQLYDIISQMKTLIEQNKQQAREILIQNPQLTRALFQAQIMLGMVKPPQVIPNIRPAASVPVPAPPQQQQQSVPPPAQQLGMPALNIVQGGFKDQGGAPPVQPPVRKQHQNQPAATVSSASIPLPAVLQSQPIPSHPPQTPQQPRGHLSSRVNPMSVGQSSQLPNTLLPPHHFISQPPPLHHAPNVSTQLQQPLQTGSSISHMPLQPPMQPQPRGPSMPSFQQQYGNQMAPSGGFQHSGTPWHASQPMFHSGNRPQSGVGYSFSSGQLPHLSQPMPQSSYQVRGSQLGADFGNQHGSSMQIDRGPSWMSGPSDNSAISQITGPPVSHGPMGPGSQPPRPGGPGSALLTPEMEKTLLQQVMSLTPDQINLLPPEQRNQVLQLQQMLRQ